MTKFESSVKEIPHSIQAVYDKISDLNNLAAVKDRLPEDKVKNLHFDADTLSVEVAPVGELKLEIVEREPCKCVKFGTVQSPLPFNLWIQLVETGQTSCKMRVTVGLDVNPFMKAMVQKPLQEGVEKMVEMLALIPYTAE